MKVPIFKAVIPYMCQQVCMKVATVCTFSTYSKVILHVWHIQNPPCVKICVTLKKVHLCRLEKITKILRLKFKILQKFFHLLGPIHEIFDHQNFCMV